jgi:hypothetical protein
VPDSVVLTLRTGPYQVTTGDDGFDLVQIEGFDPLGAPGDPALPGRVYNIAVPPDVDWDSLTVEVLGVETSVLPGSYEIAPAPPFATWVDGQQIVAWGEHTGSIVDGKNTGVYGNDAYFPTSCIVPIARAQMRKWRFVRLLFTPVQVNPITQKLRVVTEVEVRVAFERRPVVRAQAQAELNDTVMDDEAARILYNYDQARGWYEPGDAPMNTNTGADFVIITTDAIVAGSNKLSDFVAHKRAKGYTVEVVTEGDYGGLIGQSPDGTAEKIRQWLINNYVTKQIEYVLLIGNPDPQDPSSSSDIVGDVPMKMCWPRYHDTGYRESPTDYFYADLTGNWDLDGDTYFGEYDDDRGSGGVDFAVELYVGRIPVYRDVAGWETTLDNILQKIMDYDDASDQAWRKAALLPMSFSDASTDGACLAEHMESDYLNGSGYTSYTLYQQVSGSDCDSTFESDEPLVDGAVRNRWQNNHYGIVTWWAHGSPTGAYIGYSGCGSGAVLTDGDTSSLDDSHAAFVYQCSCHNGYPEVNNNLGYALLKQGAIGTVSASRVSWYVVGSWSPGQYADNASIGYYFVQQIANAERAGKALYDAKSTMGSFGLWSTRWMNLMDFNLYGDPSTRILGDGSVCDDLHEPNDTQGQATPIAYGDALADADICLGGDVDYYVFTGNAGDHIAADVDAQVIGSALDSYLFLYDSTGGELASNDDYDGGDSYIEYTLPADGTYTLMVRASGHPDVGGPDHFYTLRLFAVASFPFCDGFESGHVGTGWTTYTTGEGQVRVSSSYPYSGTYSVLLDDSVKDATYSHAALILTIDLSGQSNVVLDFWWRDFYDEDHAADGVFLSDDWGTTWFTATNLTGSQSSFTHDVVDVAAAASTHGLTLNDHFQIKLQFYDNEPIASDGYAIDEVCVQAPPKIEISPTSLEETVDKDEVVARTLTISNIGHAVLEFGLAEVEGQFTPWQVNGVSSRAVSSTPRYSVALYDHSATDGISYWYGSNSNAWRVYQTILEADPEDRFDVTVVTDLSPATLAGFSRLILPDNAVPDVYLDAVSAWFTPGKRIIAIDSATCYAAYSGFMWPASAGGNGYEVYWDYLSDNDDQQVLVSAKITEDYTVGQVLSSCSGDAQMFSAGLLPEALQLTAKHSDHSLVYVSSREVPGKGTIVVLGPYAPTVASELYALVRDAVAGEMDADVPWLYEDPLGGTVPAGAAWPVDVIFDASVPEVAQPGEYHAILNVSSSDPINSSMSIPVTMTVNVPATWGKIEGTVTGLGRCDADPAPLVNADVWVESSAGTTWTLQTDGVGAYGLWLDESHGPLTVTAVHADHVTGQATGITVVAQQTTVQDLDLRWMRPCLSVVPTNMGVTLALSGTTTRTLTISNSGALMADFTLLEADRGSALAQFQDGDSWPFSLPFNFSSYGTGYQDVPWLSKVPITGTVAAGAARSVDVIFDASVPQVTQPGEYYATLFVQGHDPSTLLFGVPVTMTVVTYGVALEPLVSAQSGAPGAIVTYALQITNAGTTTDTFAVNVSGQTWLISLSGTVGPLAAGTSTEEAVAVSIPESAASGEADTAIITITSWGDDTKSATATLTTTTKCPEPPSYDVFLPLILK